MSGVNKCQIVPNLGRGGEISRGLEIFQDFAIFCYLVFWYLPNHPAPNFRDPFIVGSIFGEKYDVCILKVNSSLKVNWKRTFLIFFCISHWFSRSTALLSSVGPVYGASVDIISSVSKATILISCDTSFDRITDDNVQTVCCLPSTLYTFK